MEDPQHRLKWTAYLEFTHNNEVGDLTWDKVCWKCPRAFSRKQGHQVTFIQWDTLLSVSEVASFFFLLCMVVRAASVLLTLGKSLLTKEKRRGKNEKNTKKHTHNNNRTTNLDCLCFSQKRMCPFISAYEDIIMSSRTNKTKKLFKMGAIVNSGFVGVFCFVF